jgi:hypothetical protein
VDIPAPTTSQMNTSYTLTFKAPQLICNVTESNSSSVMDIVASEPLVLSLEFPGLATSWDSINTLTIIRRRALGYYSLLHSVPNSTYLLNQDVTQICRAFSTSFMVNVFHANNIQRVSYITTNPETMWVPSRPDVWNEIKSSELIFLPAEKEIDPKDWAAKVSGKVKNWDTFTLVDAPMSMLTQNVTGNAKPGGEIIGTTSSPNGTVLELRAVAEIDYWRSCKS